MRKFLLIAVSAVALSACSRAAPDAGEQGVLIQKPWFFGHGGIVEEPVMPGLTFAAFTTSVVYVKMTPQAYGIEYSDIMSSDGIPLDFEATLTLKVIDSVTLVKNFQGGLRDDKGMDIWFSNNVEPVLNNYVRDSFREHSMVSLAIENSGTNAAEAEVKMRIEAYIKARNIPVEVVNFTMGRVNPPKEIKSQRTKTAEEQQRQQTELQTKIAEDNRKTAETARAAADDAYRNTMGLSPEQFVDLQRIQMEAKVCSEGKCTFVVGNAQPIINTK